jgi:hypothetical protein
MSNLFDILALVINVVSIFASVSFAASAATGAIVDVLQLRARSLLNGVQDLLFDPAFKGLARAFYNSNNINPLGSGIIENKAEVRLDTTTISPDTFATTILQILHVVPAAKSPLDGNTYVELDTPDLTESDRIKNAVANAELVLNQLVSEGLRPHATHLVKELITRGKADPESMATVAKAWFNTGMAQVAEQFSRRIRFSNFVVAILIAAILNLQPIPLGGFTAFIPNKEGGPSSTALAGDLPYVIAAFQWLIVGLASLPGAQFWYSLLNWLVARYQKR